MDSFFGIGGLTLGVRGSYVATGPLARFGVRASRPQPLAGSAGGEPDHDGARHLVGAGETPALQISVRHVDHIEPPEGALLFDSGGVWKLFDGYRIDCHSPLFGDAPYKSARVSSDLREVEIRMRVDLDPLEFPLDELLVNALLAQRRGVELHACGVIDGGQGLLFIGNSGDGKTTTARLWQNQTAEIVSDDRVIVRAENGGWMMYGTPWHGEADICSAASAPRATACIRPSDAASQCASSRSARASCRAATSSWPVTRAASRRTASSVLTARGLPPEATTVPTTILTSEWPKSWDV